MTSRTSLSALCTTLVSLALLAPALLAAESSRAEESRQIEEITVTAERKEASIQDTSISITAFTEEMIDDFGIRNQSDLQNLVPATTIQPYDSAIRGVGRNFRNLGGDPGVATYMNGVYSEDLYTATIGSFWDMDRIEVLRGPQGTLYGRNAVGGAMNFIYRKPTDEFELLGRTVLGTYGTRDLYGAISGPLIEDVLTSRLTMSSRQHDGWVEEKGMGPDLDSGDETNVALQFAWRITDDMTLHVRSNKADVDRVFGGADGGGLIVLVGENNIIPGGDGLRNYTVQAHGIRAVDATVANPLDSAFLDPRLSVLRYTNPTTGAELLAQRIRPGIDPAGGSGFPNHGRNVMANPADCVFLDRENIKGGDLCAYTNGINSEIFDQQGNQAEFEWAVNDTTTFKYIFGYNDLIYHRITDDDSTASATDDRSFYVNHEAEYVSHELQLFWELPPALSFTSGVFFYDATIDQRYDFYSATSAPQFTDPNWGLDGILAAAAPGAVPGDPPLMFLAGLPSPVNSYTAREMAQASGYEEGVFTGAVGTWLGDATLGSVKHGIDTPGSDLHGNNKTEREAFAIYTQAVWELTDLMSLTAGVRYAYDDVMGSEDYVQYSETMGVLNALGIPLGIANVLRGALDPATLQPTGLVEPWLGGTPITFGAHRHLARRDEKTTFRLNLDYALDDDAKLYGNITTGYRSGGFNLTFFSQTPTYEPEELTAYELGYKGQFLDRTMQVNGSIYLYDYSSIHTRTEEACPPQLGLDSLSSVCAIGVSSTTSIEATPGAQVTGLELEVLWLPTPELTLGGNFSLTNSEYTESFVIIDGADPTVPQVLYNLANNADRGRDIKGNQLLQVPKNKASVFASYGFDLGQSGALELLGTWAYISDVYFAAYESELDKAPAYDRFDLRGTWTSPSSQWTVTGFVHNVFDEIGIRQILRHGAVDGYRRTAQVSEPRLLGLEVSYSLRP